ncbi:MAG: hypothetical protein WC460_03555 [Patescibacteria group bacterium]
MLIQTSVDSMARVELDCEDFNVLVTTLEEFQAKYFALLSSDIWLNKCRENCGYPKDEANRIIADLIEDIKANSTADMLTDSIAIELIPPDWELICEIFECLINLFATQPDLDGINAMAADTLELIKEQIDLHIIGLPDEKPN